MQQYLCYILFYLLLCKNKNSLNQCGIQPLFRNINIYLFFPLSLSPSSSLLCDEEMMWHYIRIFNLFAKISTNPFILQEQGGSDHIALYGRRNFFFFLTYQGVAEFLRKLMSFIKSSRFQSTRFQDSISSLITVWYLLKLKLPADVKNDHLKLNC